MRPILTVLPLTVLLAACSDWPQLDHAISPEARRAGYPTLVPIDDVLDRRALAVTSPRDAASLAARAANLRARARLLRGIVVDEDTRLRLSPTLNSLGG